MGRKSLSRQANLEQCRGCILFNLSILDCDLGLAPFTPRCIDEKQSAEEQENKRVDRLEQLQKIANKA